MTGIRDWLQAVRLERYAAVFAARELLAPIYGWFTEGFDTKNLKDITALLIDLETAR